ncbi:MAG: L,D-transpeptidase family protein [Chthoniobacterales bacterium]
MSTPAADLPKADHILVEKAKRTLSLMRGGKVLKTYQVALGPNPVGPKEKEGDGKTPEGVYRIDWRNPQSQYHLSLHISYPDEKDVTRAKKQGVSPGGDIMIHGLPNGMGALGAAHRLTNWTVGCIAVTNEEIQEIWNAVPDGTSIEIRP